jgi:lipopolysaccharide export LptBFGC system permease protein LptF
MMPFFRTIDRYVAREFLRLFIIFILAAPLLFIIGDWTDNIGRYTEQGLPVGRVALSYVYQLPLFISWSFPVAALIATVFTVGNMSRHSEMTAAKAGGLSFFRTLAVLPLLGILLTAASLALTEVVPVATAKNREILGQVQTPTGDMRHEFVYTGPDGHVFTIRRLSLGTATSPPTIGGITVEFLTAGSGRAPTPAAAPAAADGQDNGEGASRGVPAPAAEGAGADLAGAPAAEGAGADQAGAPAAGMAPPAFTHISARSGSWDAERRLWTLEDGFYRVFVGEGQGEERSFSFSRLQLAAFHATPEQLMARPKDPEEMRYAELGNFIRALERSGAAPLKLMVEHAQKIAIPMATLVIILFGAPLANSSPRGGAAYGIGISLAITIIYMMLIRIAGAAGAAGTIEPLHAAWIPNAVFALAALVLLARVRT